jgi:hypothetical protein
MLATYRAAKFLFVGPMALVLLIVINSMTSPVTGGSSGPHLALASPGL